VAGAVLDFSAVFYLTGLGESQAATNPTQGPYAPEGVLYFSAILVLSLTYFIACLYRSLNQRDKKLREVESVVENSNRLVAMASPDGHLAYMNPAGLRMLGLESDSAGRMNLSDLYTEEGRELYRNSIWKAVQEDGRWEGEAEVRNFLTGALIPVWQTVYWVKNRTEKTAVLATIGQDITDRKLAEEERRAKELAETASETKTRFLATISHEIRTPLNGVLGMSDLLLESELNQEQLRCAEIIQSSAKAILSQVNNILDFSKIEQNKLELDPSPFELCGVVQNVVEALAVKAYGKGVDFTWDIEPGAPTLLVGDSVRLGQILFNLAGNAVKFTERGEVFLSVARNEELGDGVKLRFSVMDTGVGIPADRIDRIFLPFVQADGTTTKKFGGTGLGLAICKQLVKHMGGEIGVTSEPGRGSTFWFTAKLGKQAAGNSSTSPQEQKFDGARVLVVDRQGRNRDVLRNIFTAWGCRCEEAANDTLALKALRSGGDPFRFVMWDSGVPSMYDPEIAEQIKLHSEKRQTAFLLMIHLNQSRNIKQMLGGGFQGYVLKPIDRLHLADAISVAMEGSQSSHAEAVPIRSLTKIPQFNARVLIAEDQPTNLEVAVSMLNKVGVRADSAENGAEAVLALQRNKYDMVLMDCEMPEMDGFEATRRIRLGDAGMENFRIPIVAVTAHATQETRDKCLAAGMNDYISKPFEIATVIKVLSAWLPASMKQTEKTVEAVVVEKPPVPVVGAPVDFDAEGLLNRLMGDKDIARAVIGGFVEDFPLKIEELKSLFASSDAVAARREAHSLKGAAATVAAEALRAIGLAMEQAAAAGELEKAAALLPQLEKQFPMFVSALERCDWMQMEKAKGVTA
jgi:two-component system, sensor histidine kinase and response regulator